MSRDTRGVSSSTGATYMATGVASRQVRLPPSAVVPAQPTGPFTATFRYFSTDPGLKDPAAGAGQLPITFSLTYAEDGMLAEATASLGGDPGG